MHIPFPHAVSAMRSVLLIFTLIWTNQGNYLEIAMHSKTGCVNAPLGSQDKAQIDQVM